MDPASAGKSPETLTDLGKKVSEEIKAREWMESFTPLLSERAKGKQEYEIYDICNAFIREEHQFSDEEKELIKATACENAVEPYSVLSALVIELRDRLLELQEQGSP